MNPNEGRMEYMNQNECGMWYMNPIEEVGMGYMNMNVGGWGLCRQMIHD